MSIQAVCALISLGNNTFLGVSRKDNHKDFSLPGGKIDLEETHEEALHREVLEETGFSIQIEQGKPYFEDTEKGYTVRTYKAFLTGTTPKEVSPEEGIVKPVTKEELIESSFGNYNLKMLKHFNIF